MRRQKVAQALLIGSLALAPLTGCEENPRTSGAVIGGAGGAAAGALIAGGHRRILGALLGGALGAGGGYLIGSQVAKANDRTAAVRANEYAQTHPVTIEQARHAYTADINGDGYVTMDEVVAMQRAGLSDDEMIRRLERTGQFLGEGGRFVLRPHIVNKFTILYMGFAPGYEWWYSLACTDDLHVLVTGKGEHMASVQDILTSKGHAVHTISPNKTVLEATQIMNQCKIGSLVVVDGDRIVGMFTERDVLHRVVACELQPRAVRVEEVMTSDVIFCGPDTDVDDAARIIRDKRIRHLPVCDGKGQLLGLISIGDINAHHASRQEAHIDFLHSYCFGRA